MHSIVFNMKNTFLLVLVTAAVTSILSVALHRIFEPDRDIIIQDHNGAKYTSLENSIFSDVSQRKFISSAPTNFIAAAETVTPAVVNIKAIQGGDFDFFGGSLGASSGSGVIISPDGYVITNNHVIEGASDIQVTMNDRKDYEAKLIGTDPSTDIALLKIVAKNLPYITMGNSDSIRIGEWVLAVGNPFNLESTVTAGIVSAKGRNINILEDQYSIESFIQTDAAVNPGNSGGALVNTNGELVGINTAIVTKSGRYEGYSFAVPSNLVRKVVHDLKEFQVVQRGFMGIGIEDLTSERASELGVSSLEGVYINRIHTGGAAADAGLKAGDIITAVENVKIKSKPDLLEHIGRYRPGNTIQIEFIRNQKKYVSSVTLKNKSNTTSLTASIEDDILQHLGFELRNLTKEESRNLKTSGVKVISVNTYSKIGRTNMEPGFIIQKINDQKITDIDQCISKLKSVTGKITLEGIYEDYPDTYYYTFPK